MAQLLLFPFGRLDSKQNKITHFISRLPTQYSKHVRKDPKIGYFILIIPVCTILFICLARILK